MKNQIRTSLMTKAARVLVIILFLTLPLVAQKGNFNLPKIQARINEALEFYQFTPLPPDNFRVRDFNILSEGRIVEIVQEIEMDEVKFSLYSGVNHTGKKEIISSTYRIPMSKVSIMKKAIITAEQKYIYVTLIKCNNDESYMKVTPKNGSVAHNARAIAIILTDKDSSDFLNENLQNLINSSSN